MRTTRLCILIISLATSFLAGAALAREDNLGIAPIDSKIITEKTDVCGLGFRMVAVGASSTGHR
jgi:hypothetical protein